MDTVLKNVEPEDIHENPFELIGDEWMLITAGPVEAFNTMTASWGALGVLWNKEVAFCVVRPVRYTYEFMERSNTFTLLFFDSDYRTALELCGSRSGRDIDKAKEAGLTPVAGELDGTTTFAEARMVLECRKIYYTDIDPARFLDPGIDNNYPQKDYHRMYVGEIVNCRTR